MESHSAQTKSLLALLKLKKLKNTNIQFICHGLVVGSTEMIWVSINVDTADYRWALAVETVEIGKVQSFYTGC